MKFQDNKSRKEVYAKGQEISEWKYEVVALGGIHKLRLQDEVGRWLSKYQQMSTGVGRWSVQCQRLPFVPILNMRTTRSQTK